jgi:predicted ATPase
LSAECRGHGSARCGVGAALVADGVDRFGAGTAFVPLSAVTQPELVLAGVARAVGAELGTSSPLEALAEYFGDDQWLLILDNLEQVAAAARDLDALLARCRGVVILATSRTVLGLRAEWGRAPTPNITGVSRNAEMARETACRSSASSPSVELTNTRRRRSGVRMTASPGSPSSPIAPAEVPPCKSPTSRPRRQ